MCDQQTLGELNELESWYRTLPAPTPDPAALHRVRAAVAAHGVAHRDAGLPGLSSAAKQALKSRVRHELAVRRGGVRRLPGLGTAGLRPWLAAAAAVGFVLGVYGLLDRAGRTYNGLSSIDLRTTARDLDLADIELGILELEWKAYARDLVISGSEGEDGGISGEIDDLMRPTYFMDFVGELEREGIL